jgi:hypothetical protein
MFEDLTTKKAIRAIKSLIKENNINDTKYAVWWNRKLLSPARIITKHYELEGSPIKRKSINTDQAQLKLLALGFPIVENNSKNNFFTNKELTSFKELIKRKVYNKEDEVDKNIGYFLNQVIWEKSKIWRDKLTQLGWKTDKGTKNWQRQSRGKGQSYKDYTWYRIYPENFKTKLLFFTIGVGNDGNLFYKFDIKRNDPFFTSKLEKEFDALKISLTENYKVILKEDLYNSSWSNLIAKSDNYFNDQTDNLYKILYHFWPEKRLMRLVYNDKNWQTPMERYWNKSWQGRTDKAHHEQYGFGFEEWLFNPRYLIGGLQYGYVRGIDTMPANATFINELYLYTLNPQSNQKYLVAKLIDVDIYRNESEVKKKVLRIFEDGRNEMLLELEQVNADTSFLRKMLLRPNLSFNLDSAIIYDEPIMLPEDFLKIHRFIPNKVEGTIEKIINNIDISFKDPKLDFKEGNGTGSNSYSQIVTGGKRNVNRSHSDITNALHKYLCNSKDYNGYKISTEKTKVGNNLVDCAAKKADKLNLFEVKTTNSFLTNVRLALGQVIEYALLDKSINIEELIIVGPVKPNKRDLIYFETLKEKLALPISYWSFSFEEKQLQKKFTKH